METPPRLDSICPKIPKPGDDKRVVMSNNSSHAQSTSHRSFILSHVFNALQVYYYLGLV